MKHAKRQSDLKRIDQVVDLPMVSLDSGNPVVLSEEGLQERLPNLFLDEGADIFKQSARQVVISPEVYRTDRSSGLLIQTVERFKARRGSQSSRTVL